MQNHGGDIYLYNKKILDFSVNINPLGTPQSVIDAGKDALERADKYPDVYCRSLRAAIEDIEGISRDNIICGNGAAELIYSLVFALRPKKALIPQPTFGEYEQAVKAAGGEVLHYYTKAENNYAIDRGFLDCINEGVDMVFICNPNNPTGVCTPKKTVLEILERCKKQGAFVVTDECFLDFVNNGRVYSASKEINTHNNLFVLKSFTKLYAMAGVRLGWGVCANKPLLSQMYAARQPWSVSCVAQAMGEAALKEHNFSEKTPKYIACERAYLENELTRLNIEYIKSEANYILIKSPLDLYTPFLEKNILIRDCEGFKGLGSGFYRIAVKRREDNARLIRAMEEALNG